MANGKSQMTLTIRKENFPTRCDICHQSDRFDPATGTCQRCLLVFENKSVPARPEVKELPAQSRWLRQCIRLVWLALVTVLSICLVGWLVSSTMGSSLSPKRLVIQLGVICLVTALVTLRLLYLPALYAPIVNPLKRDVVSSFLWVAVFLSSLVTSVQFTFYLRPINLKNGSGPVQTLRNVYSAEVSYSLGIGKGNYTADLGCLGGTAATSVGFLDNTVTAAQTVPKSGYLLGPVHITPAEGKTPGTFSLTAFPLVAKGEYRTGDDCYYLDETGIIRHSGRPDVMPDARSEPIQ